MRTYQRGAIWYALLDDGRRVSLRTKDGREAQRNLADFLAAEREARKPTITVEEIWHEYAQTLAGRPAAERAAMAWKKIGPAFGSSIPARITEQSTRAFAGLHQTDATGTTLVELVFLRTALNWAHRRQLIDKCYYVWCPPAPPPRDKRITKAEARTLLDAAESPHVRLFILLAVSTAGRHEALLDLTWSRVDFDRGQLDLAIKGRRGKGRALVPMNGTLRAALLDARSYALTEHVIEWGAHRLLSIGNGFRRTASKAGMGWVTPHVLRHSAATWMAEAGIAMERIAQYLGHANPATTYRVYARWTPDYQRDAAEALEIGGPVIARRRRG